MGNATAGVGHPEPIGPALVHIKRGRLQRLVERHRPDLVHAMRIPFEGIAAGELTGLPVIVSVWGNDFTLRADRNRMMATATRRALATAEVLHCDCHRDARMAREWGFPVGRLLWVLPGETAASTGPSSTQDEVTSTFAWEYLSGLESFSTRGASENTFEPTHSSGRFLPCSGPPRMST